MIDLATDVLREEVNSSLGNQGVGLDVESLLLSETFSEDDRNISDYGPELVGSRITVFWVREEMYFNGKITSYNARRKLQSVQYGDGDFQELDLVEERFAFLN